MQIYVFLAQRLFFAFALLKKIKKNPNCFIIFVLKIINIEILFQKFLDPIYIFSI